MSQSSLGSALRQSAYSSVGTLSIFLVNFLFAGLTIRYLGVERAGFFILLSSLLGVSQIVGGLGLVVPATGRLAELFKEGKTPACCRLIGSVVFINVVIGLLVAVASVSAFDRIFEWSKMDPMLVGEARLSTLFMAMSFLGDQVGSGYRFVYAACQRQDIRNISMSVAGLCGGVIKIVALKIAPNMVAVAGATMIISIAWALFDVVAVRCEIKKFVWPLFHISDVRPLLRFSVWENVNNIGIYAVNSVDRFVITAALGSQGLPYYTVAQRFFQQIHTAIAQQFAFLFPMLASEGKDVYTRIAKIESRARWLVALVGSLAYASLFLVGPLVLTFLVGAEFAEKCRIAMYLVAIQGFAASLIIVNYLMNYAVGDGTVNALLNVGNGFLSCTLALLLIPRYGIVGASVAQLAIVVSVFLFLWRSHGVLKLPGTVTGKYWTPYITPTIAFCVTIIVGIIIQTYWGNGFISVTMSFVCGLVTGLLLLFGFERWVFGNERRVEWLMYVFGVIVARITKNRRTNEAAGLSGAR